MTGPILVWILGAGIAVGIVFVFWSLSKLLKRLILTTGEKAKIDGHVLNLAARSVECCLIVFGIITALGTIGIDVSALVAGLGLTGFALGFALKDTISNLLAGVLLLIYQPFKVSDRIKVIGFNGTVTSIDLRYTTLQGENERILIPNSSLFTNPIAIL